MSLTRRLPFYYGWVIVAVCALLLIIVFGIRLSFSVFFVALIEEFGWSRGDTSLIFSTTMIVFMLSSTLSGWALDRFGVRITFGIGAVVLALGLALSSRISTLSHLVFTYGVVAGLGIAILGLSMQASIIARWFRQRLGTAIGIAFAGTGVGSFVMTPMMELTIGKYGWRMSYLILAGLIAGTIPIIFLFLRQHPTQLGLHIDDGKGDTLNHLVREDSLPEWTLGKVIRSPAFWLVFVAGLCTMGPIRLLTVHQLAIMADAGISTSVGARAVGLAGATTAVTFVLAGILSDRIGRTMTYAIGGLSLIGAILLLLGLGATNQNLVWLYAILLGLGEGSRSSLVMSVAGDLFAGRTLGAINGTVGAAFGAGAALYPWLGGVIFDHAGSYQTAYLLAIGTILLAMSSLWLATRFSPTSG